jgi:hypothetical protein
MKREPIPEEYPVHVVRRGARGLPFVRSNSDKWRGLRVLYYLNDASAKQHWLREIEEGRVVDFRSRQTGDFGSRQAKKSFFRWPASWPERNPLIVLAAFTFNSNHDHLIVWERQERGLSQFMQKTGISVSKHFNEKYKEQGTVLKPYTFKVIESDRYLQRVVPYVMVKNTFEMHPNGYQWAVHNFEQAWEWAIRYPFSSLGDYAGIRNSPIVDTARLKEILGTSKEFKSLCKDMILNREHIGEDEMSETIHFSLEED